MCVCVFVCVLLCERERRWGLIKTIDDYSTEINSNMFKYLFLCICTHTHTHATSHEQTCTQTSKHARTRTLSILIPVQKLQINAADGCVSRKTHLISCRVSSHKLNRSLAIRMVHCVPHIYMLIKSIEGCPRKHTHTHTHTETLSHMQKHSHTHRCEHIHTNTK